MPGPHFKESDLEAQAKEDDAPANGGDGEAQARLAALEAELKAQKRAAKDADEARAQEKMLGALRTQLLAAGVPPTRVDHAIAHLHHAQGRIGLSDDGQAVIRFDRESAGGKYQDHLGLDAGLAEWLDTDDGRAFLPPARVAGKDDHNSGRQPFITKGPSGQTQVNTKGLISKVLDRAARG